MSGFFVFVIVLALILIGGYFKAKREANSTPLRRSFNRAASNWNQADPKHRARMLESVGVFEHSPSFAVYLTSTWAQLDLNLCALLAATMDASRDSPNLLERTAGSIAQNPAMDELKLQPQTAVTVGLISAIPHLAAELYREAAKKTGALGVSNPVFTECVFDLLLVGVFEKTLAFADDKNLASLFVDAIVFEALGKAPSAPDHPAIFSGETDGHRGIAKYALAMKHSSPGNPDPGTRLFGTEYARAKGNHQKLTEVFDEVLYIRRAGTWIAEKVLFGRFPTQEEMGALPNAIKAAE